MITEVAFLSVGEVWAEAPTPSAVVISILDPSERHEAPDFTGFRDLLLLDFEDTYEKDKDGAQPWPDAMSDAEHAAACSSPGHHAPQLEDARRILAFIKKHHTDAKPLRLIVHCFGGISRSSAIAFWVARALEIPLVVAHDRSVGFANRRILRLLSKANGTEWPEAGPVR